MKVLVGLVLASFALSPSLGAAQAVKSAPLSP